jgi:starch synthase
VPRTIHPQPDGQEDPVTGDEGDRGAGWTEAVPPDVIHLAAECWPFVRTGGLAEAVRGLADFQKRGGSNVSILLPLHRQAREVAGELVPVGESFPVQVGPRTEMARLFTVRDPGEGPTVLFVDHAEWFDRSGVYGEGGDYADNHIRFAFFCLAALTVLPSLATSRRLVLHAHDWHAALAALYLRTQFAGSPVHDRTALVLSVHNAGYQGHFPASAVEELGIDPGLYDWRCLEWYGRANLLKGGLTFADRVTTVSPTHAVELRTPAGGFGLHEVFVGLGERLVGILNGIDFEAWNPATDLRIAAHFSRDELAGKSVCKAALQQEYGLPPEPTVPIVAMAARLVQQKGMEIILGSRLLREDPPAQFIFLGTGDPAHEAGLASLAAASPRIAFHRGFTDDQEHRLIAGSDILLMPSLYEPCGLTQMRAQRYGTIPVARRVGGLADTIEDGVTGILFEEFFPDRLDAALRRAFARYREGESWLPLMRAAMARDFSWAHVATQYMEVYNGIPTHPRSA